MGRTPAAILTIFIPTEKHWHERVSLFKKYVEEWVNEPVVIQPFPHLQDKGKSKTYYYGGINVNSTHSNDNWNVSKPSSKDFSKIQILLFISYFDGLHENICLEKHRKFVEKLVLNQVVDVVTFPYGLPRNNPKWYSKYRSGVILGWHSFIAVELIMAELFLKKNSLVEPVNDWLDASWDELNNDKELVEIKLSNSKSFLENFLVPLYFKELMAINKK